MANSVLRQASKLFNYREQLTTNIVGHTKVHSPISSNILFTAGSGSTTYETSIDERDISVYYTRLKEIERYELTDLSETIVTLYKDYITNSIVMDNSPITIKNEKFKKHEQLITKLFKDLDLVSELFNNLNNFIFYGSHSVNIKYDKKEKRLLKRDLVNPNSVIPVYEGGKLVKNLTLNHEGDVIEIPPFSVIRFGANELHLLDDYNEREYSPLEILRDSQFLASKPLYYGMISKVKEYLLKDKLISLLSIKDLIQPLVFLIGVEKTTSSQKATELAQNTERLINNYVDTSSFLTGTFSVNELVNALISNVKVLPDFNSALQGMNTLDLSKLSDKVEGMRAEQDATKEDILNTTGVPLDLFLGRASKWEALKTSERLNSKVNTYINIIKTSFQKAAAQLVFLVTEEVIPHTEFAVNIFTKTAIDYNNAINNSEAVTTLMEAVKNIITDAEEIASKSKIIDPKLYLTMVRERLNDIDTDLGVLMTDDIIEKFLKTPPPSDEE